MLLLEIGVENYLRNDNLVCAMSIFEKDELGVFSKYSEQLKEICIEEYGVPWNTKRKTYEDGDGKRHPIDAYEMKHHSTQIFLSNWLNRTGAYKSGLFKLNEWIETNWSWSRAFDCFMVNLLAESQDEFSFDDLVKYIQGHNNFNETKSDKKARMEEKKRDIEDKYQSIKTIQSSIGYKLRLFLNKKLQGAFKKLPILEKSFNKKKVFRTKDDLIADTNKNLLDEKKHWIQTHRVTKSKPTFDFENIRRIFIETKEDWIRELLIGDILFLSKKNKKIKDMEYNQKSTFELWSQFCLLAYKNSQASIGDDDSESKQDIWTAYSYEMKKKDKQKFFEFEAGVNRVIEIFSPQYTETKLFTFLMILYKSINDAEWKSFWNYWLVIEHEEEIAKPGFFAQTVINRETFSIDIFGLNYREYRLLNILEGFEKSPTSDWNEYMKANHFSFY